jgi:hypothetical protein
MPEDRRADIHGRQIFESLRESLRQRLASVCSHFNADDLQRLVEKMARIQIRYGRSTAVPPA